MASLLKSLCAKSVPVTLLAMGLLLLTGAQVRAKTLVTDDQDYQGAYSALDVKDIQARGPRVDVRAYGASTANNTNDLAHNNSDAIEVAIDAIVTAGGGTLYVPECYWISRTISLPCTVPFALIGRAIGIRDGNNNAKPSGFYLIPASSDWAIEYNNTVGGQAMKRLVIKNLRVYGSGTGAAGTTNLGGIRLVTAVYAVVDNIVVEQFCSAGWTTSGNEDTDLRAGIKLEGGVGNSVSNVYCRYNDIGFFVDTSASVATTTHFEGCVSGQNRTHAVKVVCGLQITFSNCIFESNRGKYTVRVSGVAEGYPLWGIRFENIWFEGNHLGYGGTPAVGAREIYAHTLLGAPLYLENIFIQPGINSWCDIPIELEDSNNSHFEKLFVAAGAGATSCAKINANCAKTTVAGCYFSSGVIIDLGTNTFMWGSNGQLSFGAGPTATGGTISAYAFHIKALAGIMTEFMYASKGQIILVEGQSGTVLSNSSSKFVFAHGGPAFYLGAGEFIALRWDGTHWVELFHSGGGYDKVVAKTGAYSVSAYEDRGTVFTNEGAAGAVTFTLPSAEAGLRYTFVRCANQNVRIQAAAGDTINGGTAGKIYECVTAGETASQVTLVAVNATQWIVLGEKGTWVNNNN